MRGLSDPSVEINDAAIEIVPGTLSIKRGKGDKNVLVQTAGGGAVQTVVTYNVETQKSMVKFSLRTTDVNRQLVTSWQESAGNTIRTFEGDVIDNFRAMHIITEPEWAFGADSTTEITFEGPPAI